MLGISSQNVLDINSLTLLNIKNQEPSLLASAALELIVLLQSHRLEPVPIPAQVKASVGQGKCLAVALKEGDYNLAARLCANLPKGCYQRLLSLSCARDEAQFQQGVLELALSLGKDSTSVPEALLLLQWLEPKVGIDTGLADQIQQETKRLTGTGTLLEQARWVVNQGTSAEFLAPMVAAQLSFGLSRVGFAKTLFKNLNPGLKGVTSGVAAFGVEGLSFGVTEQQIGLAQEREVEGLEKLVPHALYTMAWLRLSGMGVSTSLGSAWGMKSLARLGKGAYGAKWAAQKLGEFSGMVCSQVAAPVFRMGPVAGPDLWSNSAKTVLQFAVGVSLLHGAFPKYEQVSQVLHEATAREVRGKVNDTLATLRNFPRIPNLPSNLQKASVVGTRLGNKGLREGLIHKSNRQSPGRDFQSWMSSTEPRDRSRTSLAAQLQQANFTISTRHPGGQVKMVIAGKNSSYLDYNFPEASELYFKENGDLERAKLSEDCVLDGIPCHSESEIIFFRDKLTQFELSRSHEFPEGFFPEGTWMQRDLSSYQLSYALIKVLNKPFQFYAYDLWCGDSIFWHEGKVQKVQIDKRDIEILDAPQVTILGHTFRAGELAVRRDSDEEASREETGEINNIYVFRKSIKAYGHVFHEGTLLNHQKDEAVEEVALFLTRPHQMRSLHLPQNEPGADLDNLHRVRVMGGRLNVILGRSLTAGNHRLAEGTRLWWGEDEKIYTDTTNSTVNGLEILGSYGFRYNPTTQSFDFPEVLFYLSKQSIDGVYVDHGSSACIFEGKLLVQTLTEDKSREIQYLFNPIFVPKTNSYDYKFFKGQELEKPKFH